MTLWDAKAKFYDRIRSLPIIRNLYAAELSNLQALVPRSRIELHLDIGCGTGSSLKIFSASQELILSDISLTMLRLARQNSPKRLSVQFDAEQGIPFKSSLFDFVSAIGVFEYLHELSVVLQEIHRVAATRAWLLFTNSPPGLGTFLRTFSGNYPQSRHKNELESILQETGWQTVDRRQTWMQEQWLCQKMG